MASRGYKIDFAKQTITMTADFEKRANNPESAEYELVRQFRHDFPKLRIVPKTHATPKRYHNGDGSITTRNKNNGLTYERMEQFIVAMSAKDDTDYLEAFYEIRSKAEAMCASPYAIVSKWFMKQFPEYRTNPLSYLDNRPEIIDFSSVLDKSKKLPSVIEAEKIGA